ncbi:MAG TPA: oligosaccharide flippase family protein [Chloroflexota bacterium]|nr:oligosaccharide flippase family protein [Chloroflexota bacterium]
MMDTAKQTLRDRLTMLVITGAGALMQTLWAVAGLIIARSIDPVSYGKVTYFFSIYGMVVLLGAIGLSTQITTELARLSASGRSGEHWQTISALGLARAATLAPIAVISALVAWRVDLIAGVAGEAGVAVLCFGFSLGIVQGLHKPVLVATLALGQAVIYLALVAAWGRTSPEHVYATLITSHLAAAASAIVTSVVLIPDWKFSLSSGLLRKWKSFARFSSQAYMVSLMAAPYATLATLALGKMDRFQDAAIFGVGLSLMIVLPTALNMVVSIQYYPRLCLLIGGSPDSARSWLDTFYRTFAVMGLASAMLLLFFPKQIIEVLFTPKYLAAVPVLQSLAPAALLMTLGNLLVWTLVAHGQLRVAITGGAVQLTILIATIVTCIALPSLPLWSLGLGHVAAAMGGLAIWGFGIKRVQPAHNWHPSRLTLAALATAGSAALLRHTTPSLDASRLATTGVLIAAGVGAVVISAPILIAQRSPHGWSL